MRHFLTIYEGLEGVTHKLPVKSDVEPTDLVVNEREDFFYSSLLAFLKKKKLVLPEEDYELDFNVECEEHDSKVPLSINSDSRHVHIRIRQRVGEGRAGHRYLPHSR